MAKIGDLLRKYNTDRRTIGQLLDQDSDRFNAFSSSACGLLMDFSRCGLDGPALKQLFELADACDVPGQRDRLFAGDAINFTENRSVLHPLWRSGAFDSLLSEEESQRLTHAVSNMCEIAGALRKGHLPGNETATVTDVVHIGIGGSLLGPRLLVDAYSAQVGESTSKIPRIHFLSSVDPGPRERLQAEIDPKTTAIIIVSKSFTTSEVMTHARSMFAWQQNALEEQACAERRFAVTSRPDRAAEWSIAANRILEMGEWTGGRYSVWSPVGLTAAIAMGTDKFTRFLAGGADMDRHFREAPMDENLPVIAALIDVWHRNICNHPGLAIIPYESRLAELPGWLQQVAMESNGKGTCNDNSEVQSETSQVIFGDCGTDAQHSFFQAFHQGTEVVPIDFIGVINSGHEDDEASARLMSHMLAQATALARGKTLTEVQGDMSAAGASDQEIEELAQHRVMPGNRPSTILMMSDMSPEILGALLVFYEHRVFVQSVLWNINAFDQWGVELGKSLADAIEPFVIEPSLGEPNGLSELTGILEHLSKSRT